MQSVLASILIIRPHFFLTCLIWLSLLIIITFHLQDKQEKILNLLEHQKGNLIVKFFEFLYFRKACPCMPVLDVLEGNQSLDSMIKKKIN